MLACGCNEKRNKNLLLRPHGCVAAHSLRTPVLRLPGACGAPLFGFGIGGAKSSHQPETSEFAGVFGTCAWGRRRDTCE